MKSAWIRVGGALGIVAAATAVPAYVVGSPEQSSAGAETYFAQAEAFLFANGTLPLLHLLAGTVFLAVLIAVLRRAAGPGPAVYAALLGGGVFLALTAAGLAAEVAVPSAISQLGDADAGGNARSFLALAIWLYHYSQIGAAVLVFSTAWIVWRTRVLPRFTVVFAVLGILPLLHTWVGVPAAYSMVAWVALTGLTLLVWPPATTEEPATAP